MKYLFPNFLTDYNEFIQSQLHWIRLCQEVLEENRQDRDWIIGAEVPQIPFSSLYEFGSWGIVGGFNFEKTKGIGINQQIPKEDAWEMSAYTAAFDKFSDTVPIIYVEFCCDLTKKSSDTFRKLFSKWIQPDVNREEIDRFIDFLNL